MTLLEAIYELKMLLRNNRLSDDGRDDDRLWEKWIVQQRALWVKNALTKNPKPTHAIVQDLGCVELELADPADCCDFDTNCKVLRTNVEIPRTIEVGGFDGITRVGSVDKFSTDYMYVDYDRSGWVGGGYFNSKAIIATRLNDYIYILSKSPDDYFKYLTFVNVRGVFENPRDVSAFTRCTGGSCFSPNSEYPMPEALWVYMKGQIIDGNFKILTSVGSDKVNNADGSETQKA